MRRRRRNIARGVSFQEHTTRCLSHFFLIYEESQSSPPSIRTTTAATANMADQNVFQPGESNKTRSSHVAVSSSSMDQTRERSRALNQKLDFALLPLLSLLYLFNGLDRGNVGNAETQGVTPLFSFASYSSVLSTNLVD